MLLYESPWGLLDFQADGVALSYLRRDQLVTWDTGMGKTHHALALACLLFEDDLIDTCLVVCEKDKLGEWADDFATYTKLTTARYYGPKRKDLLSNPPQVMVSVYETVRNDAASKVEGKQRALVSGPLTDSLVGRRVLVIYDEMTKLKNRSSSTYRHHEFLLKSILGGREDDPLRRVGLTATPIERDPENAFNIIRLLFPGFMTVSQFEEEHVKGRDICDRPYGFKNIGIADHSEPWVTPFSKKVEHILQVKHKTDPDVVDQFPRQVEEFTYVEQHPTEEKFYIAVQDLIHEESDGVFDDMAGFGLLRQIACHPHAVLHSQGVMARKVVEIVGEEGIRKIPCNKLERLLSYIEGVVRGQGAQAVVFTFFGQSVLPIIHEALTREGYKVSINHGGMSVSQREDSKRAFRAGETEIFLTSDAGSRGLNLPNASYVINYELPLTHANYIQRINRIHRIDSTHESVTCQSFITAYTVEEGVVRLNEQRNTWADLLIEDDVDEGGEDGSTRMTAEDRRAIIKLARTTVPKKDRKTRKVSWAT